MATNPMNQFKVHRIGPEIEISGVDLSFTNASLFMAISAIMISVLLMLGTREKKLVPSKIQLVSEMLYNFIAKMISDTAGKKAKPFFPFILQNSHIESQNLSDFKILHFRWRKSMRLLQSCQPRD